MKDQNPFNQHRSDASNQANHGSSQYSTQAHQHTQAHQSQQYSQPHTQTAVGHLDAFAPTFFGKVMFFFGLALLVSGFGVWASFNYLLEYFVATPGLMWVVFIAELVLVFTSRAWSKRHPLNYALFSLFALLTGISITPLLLMATIVGGTGIVIKALLATFLVFTAAALIGWKTKKSLEGLRGFLVIGLIGLIIVQIIGLFIPWGSTFEMIYTSFGVLLFTGYTMYDFQKLKSFPQDRYVDAAMHLYLDIFNLFIFILRLIMNQRS